MTARALSTIAFAALALGGCSGPEPLGEAAAPIIGGTVDQGDPAIVMLVSIPADQSTFDTCTASLIAPTVLLTAAHCVDPKVHAGDTFGVFTGADASAFPTAAEIAPQLLAVKSATVHPDYDSAPPFTADLAVVELAKPLDVTPLPIARTAPTAAQVGEAARIVGYGQTKYGEFNEVKHQAETVLAAIDMGDTVTVGDPAHLSCVGDSGGPALMMIDGAPHIVAIDSYTELKGCLEPAHYRRTDLYTAFLDPYAPPPVEKDAGAGGAAPIDMSAPEGTGCATTRHSPGGGGAVVALAIALGALLRRRRA